MDVNHNQENLKPGPKEPVASRWEDKYIETLETNLPRLASHLGSGIKTIDLEEVQLRQGYIGRINNTFAGFGKSLKSVRASLGRRSVALRIARAQLAPAKRKQHNIGELKGSSLPSTNILFDDKGLPFVLVADKVIYLDKDKYSVKTSTHDTSIQATIEKAVISADSIAVGEVPSFFSES